MASDNTLRDMVRHLDETEKSVDKVRFGIVKYLVENNVANYFQINWAKLKRDNGIMDQFGRLNAKRK